MKTYIDNRKNKRHIFYVATLVLAIFFTSCENIVDVEPYTSIPETVAFSSADYCELSVAGMYNAAQIGYADRIGSGRTNRGYPFGAASIEQGDCRGEDVVSLATFYSTTYQSQYTTSSENNTWVWSDTYRLINFCNIVIEGVKGAATKGYITAEKALSYEGEARLLRALSYHELLINFARPYKYTLDASHPGVPIYLKPFINQVAVNEGFNTGRSKVSEVYAFILEDLNFAEENLPLKAGWTGNKKICRGTKGAAVAIKTRVYLHMWDMANVITEGSKFLPGGSLAGEYSLTENPWTPFTLPYTNTESIYGMENSATNNPGSNGALASQYKRRNLIAISPIIWRSSFWRTDDKRRNETDMITTPTTGSYKGRKFSHKYKDDVNNTDPSPLIRYAEVILNLAEAYTRQNDVVNGLKYLNMVRDRALINSSTQSYVSSNFADNVALLKAILFERRIEFLCEGRRWPDISRLQNCSYFPIDGIPAKLANGNPAATVYTLGTEYTGPFGLPAIPGSDFRFLWPIPQLEVDANPTLAAQQNPEW